MKPKFNAGQHVYFIISGRIITEAVVVAASSWFVTIKFRKNEDCIIRLPHNRIYHTEEEAQKHVRPILPPRPRPLIKEKNGKYICTRRWDLWE